MMRSANAILMATLGVSVVVAFGTAYADPVASPSPPTVDAGSKTSGLAGETVPQPSGVPKIQVGADGTPLRPERGPDTPGKTGLGNNERDTLGGADKGPGTQDVVPRNAQ
jgi:hypothetical protein